MQNGRVLALDGTSGYAQAATPAVTTTSSFSVSAWVKLNDLNNFYTAVSQGGSNIGGFYLQYNHTTNAWAFIMPASDSATAADFVAKSVAAPTLAPKDAGQCLKYPSTRW